MKSSCQDILCPFRIMRAIIILVVAYFLSYVSQPIIFFAESRIEVFLFLAIFMDIFSRTVALSIEIDKDENKEGAANPKFISLRTFKALFLSNYGGQFIAPLWCFCLLIIIFNRSGIV